MKRAVQQAAPAAYPRGFFTALVRQHNWPPSFEPASSAQARQVLPADLLRAHGGFDSLPLNLPGAVEHLKRAGKR